MAAAMTVSNDWLGASADNIRITNKQGETTLSAAPTNAGTYTAGITVGEGGGAVTASVEYTIEKADLAAGDFTFTSPQTSPITAVQRPPRSPPQSPAWVQ